MIVRYFSILFVGLVCFSIASYAQVQDKCIAGFPPLTVFDVKGKSGDYTEVMARLPSGVRDTLWVKTKITLPMWRVQAQMVDTSMTVLSDDGRNMKVSINDVQYPFDAMKAGIEGKVEATCIVERDGSLTDVKLVTSLFPSIDDLAIDVLSKTKLIPCRIGNRIIRCRHKLALSFQIEQEHGMVGKIYLVNADNLSEGVSKRYKLGITKTETTNYMTTGRWHTTLEIDIPQYNPALEALLCKVLFDKKGKTIEEVGEKYARRFSGKLQRDEFKKMKGNNLDVVAHVLSFLPGRYYSYGYKISFGQLWNHENDKTVTHNFVYGIREQRMLSARDMINETAMSKILKKTGITNTDQIDIGLNENFLYLGNSGVIIDAIALSKENWHLFTPLFQNMLDKESLPFEFDRNDFEEGAKWGIQPQSIVYNVEGEPCVESSGEDIISYLYNNLNLRNFSKSPGRDLTAIISYTVEKDGSLSNLEILQYEGDVKFQSEIKRIFESVPRWKPLKLAVRGAVRSCRIFNFRVK